MDKFFEDYNSLQLSAITSEEKKVCVFAGPGTGKTKTLVVKNVSSYTPVRWEHDPAITLTQTKDMRKVKISVAAAGTYTLKAVIDGRSYPVEVTVQ